MTSRVERDTLGVAHLWADDVFELAHRQGREAAVDRAWQLEHHRWRMEGRTAEFVGARGLPWDRFARQVRLESTVRRCYDALDDETRRWVGAYVEGVNEGMPLGLPAARELHLLGLDSYAAQPRPWQPWTPLGIFWSIHLLFGSFPNKLFNAHVIDRLGAQWLPVIAAEAMPSGSNAWLVGGARTTTGSPLIAGDPHRTIDLPSCYQQVGLACPEFDVVGFTFPGVPGVQHFAHTGAVAWGITNAMADYQDLTAEQLRRTAAGALQARGVDGWEPADESVEVIRVRGEAEVDVPVVLTQRGPVITGLDDQAGGTHRPATYSLRTPAQQGGALGFDALLPLLRARTVDDVTAAFASWVEPVNSALIADTTGAMRHLLIGKVPVRHPDNQWAPVPAWSPHHRWSPGWAARASTDVTDVMVSANDRASGGGLGVDYANSFRAERIRELIDAREKVSVDDCATVHVDTFNGESRLMRKLVSDAEVADGAAEVRAELLAWNGHSDVDSVGAATFAQWRHAFVQWIARHPALTALHEPTGHSALFAAWLHVPTQVGIGWQSLARGGGELGLDVADGVRSALETVAEWRRDRPRGRAWGLHHQLDPIHALDGLPGLPTVPADDLPGDKGCVLAASSTPGVSDACSVGPVARYVWNLADRDASQWVVPFGASSRWGDPHYSDQLDAWTQGRLFPVRSPGFDGAAGPETDR